MLSKRRSLVPGASWPGRFRSWRGPRSGIKFVSLARLFRRRRPPSIFFWRGPVLGCSFGRFLGLAGRSCQVTVFLLFFGAGLGFRSVARSAARSIVCRCTRGLALQASFFFVGPLLARCLFRWRSSSSSGAGLGFFASSFARSVARSVARSFVFLRRCARSLVARWRRPDLPPLAWALFLIGGLISLDQRCMHARPAPCRGRSPRRGLRKATERATTRDAAAKAHTPASNSRQRTKGICSIYLSIILLRHTFLCLYIQLNINLAIRFV